MPDPMTLNSRQRLDAWSRPKQPRPLLALYAMSEQATRNKCTCWLKLSKTRDIEGIECTVTEQDHQVRVKVI